jgi:hypothetical protein
MAELIGSDGTVHAHEVNAGGSNTAECSAETVELGSHYFSAIGRRISLDELVDVALASEISGETSALGHAYWRLAVAVRRAITRTNVPGQPARAVITSKSSRDALTQIDQCEWNSGDG